MPYDLTSAASTAPKRLGEMSIMDSTLWHHTIRTVLLRSVLFSVTAVVFLASGVFAADKLYAIYTTHSLSHTA